MAPTLSLLHPTLLLEIAHAQLRPWATTDASALSKHANDRSIWLNLRDRFPIPFTLTDAEQNLRSMMAPEVANLHLCIAVEAEAAGGISVLFKDDVNRRSAEIGYFIGRQHWGRGIATAAVKAVTAYVLAHFDLCRLYAIVYEHNHASARVVEKAGFELEGRQRKAITKDGQTFDALVYALIS